MRRMLLALVAPVLALGLACGGEGAGDQPRLNLMLVIIDTLRADHLGAWGYERDITPTLDSLAGEGTAWLQAQAQSSWTLPSVASIMSGLTPREHGAGAFRGEMYGLDSSIPTLQRILHSRGYSTCGIFNVIFLSEDFGFHRGFDHFDCRGVTGNRGTRRADATVDAAIRWLEERDEGTPFLAVVHFYDPHIPYDPPPPFDTLFADPLLGDLRSGDLQMDTMQAVNMGSGEISAAGLNGMVDLYDGEIAFTDLQIARLMAFMRESGIGESTVVVVLGDHGEEFMEHSGIEHGRTLYQEVVRVPLIMCGPGVPSGGIVHVPAAQTDVLPTVLSLLGEEAPEGLSGADLLGGEAALLGRSIPASNLLWSGVQQASVRRDGLKIIWYAESGDHELYDLSIDPLEQSPLGTIDSSMVMSAEYYWATPPVADAPKVSFDEAESNQLRDLGYIR